MRNMAFYNLICLLLCGERRHIENGWLYVCKLQHEFLQYFFVKCSHACLVRVMQQLGKLVR